MLSEEATLKVDVKSMEVMNLWQFCITAIYCFQFTLVLTDFEIAYMYIIIYLYLYRRVVMLTSQCLSEKWKEILDIM